MIYNFCMHGGNSPHVGGEVTPQGRNFLLFYFQKEHVKIRKTNG